MRFIFAFSFLAALLACSDGASTSADASTDASTGHPDASITDAGEPTDSGTGLDEDGCRILELGDREFQFNFFGQLTGVNYLVTPNLDGDAEDRLLLELYDSTTEEGMPPLIAGSFELAEGRNADLATCQHCVWIKIDETPEGVVEAIYYQTEGTMTLTRVSDPFEPVFSGSTSRVVLRRATIDAEGHSVLVSGGDCVSITGLSFDTSTTPGEPCLSAEDCNNPILEICDPDTNTCAQPECGEFLSCPNAGHVCVSQYRDLFHGACYDSCDPTAGGCDQQERCVQFGVDPTFGICKTIGQAAIGASCELADNGTSCAGEAVCSEITRTCSASCAFYDDVTGCTNGNLCTLFGVCEPPSAGRSISIGTPCEATDELATGCAPDGEAFRGICFAYPPELPICEKACLGDRGCLGGEFCALRFTSGLGICRPLPVCGDAELGEINELCDDGNTISGDGCSSDCATVEYDVICSSLPALPFATDVAGDTSTARDGFQSSCQAGIARAELYTIAPPSPGRLTLRLTSPTNHTLALRAACEDVASERGCEEAANGGEVEELVFQVTSTHTPPLSAIVSAFTVLEQGPFTLRADFVPEQCGDGVVAGNELCDDGNTNSDDGCRSDCREVEYDFYCASAQELSTTSVNSGSTSGAAHLFASTCSTEVGSPSGADRLYRYTAPANGTLHLFLESQESLIVAAYDGCGTPAQVNELGCKAVFNLGMVDLQLTAGQTITVSVDGFLEEQQGPYDLHAMFTAD